MNTQVTDRELTLILLASMLTILIVLFIVGKWLNFHLLACCFSRARNRKHHATTSIREQSTQEPPITSFIDLNTINQSLKNNDSNVWTPVVGSISSLATNDTLYDDALMPNSNSAYDIVSYANNIKSTLKRTISCDSDNESVLASSNDLHTTEENIGPGKVQITLNYNA
ncbi:unnamed protein product [Rotaria magnacalcarata]|nr:unnamed protein product [Rotaria magnacalcarata]